MINASSAALEYSIQFLEPSLLLLSFILSSKLLLIVIEGLDALRDAIPLQPLLVHHASADFHATLPRWQVDHALVPSTDVRRPLPDLVPGLVQDFAEAEVPRCEGHVGEHHLATDQPLRFLRGENIFKHANDPLNLIGITVNSRLHSLGVQVLEPGALAIVGTLAADLEVQPPGAEMSLVETFIREAMLGIVQFDHILKDGA